MKLDIYTKMVLTVIAVSLSVISAELLHREMIEGAELPICWRTLMLATQPNGADAPVGLSRGEKAT